MQLAEIKDQHLLGCALVASFLYYYWDVSYYTDEEYDEIIKRLREIFPQIKHPCKHLIDEEYLYQSTSLFYIRDREYPNGLKHCALRMYQEKTGINLFSTYKRRTKSCQNLKNKQ